jgi:hypothetical protein
MRLLIYILTFNATILSVTAQSQRDSIYKPATGKFQIVLATGLYTDLFDVNILGPKDEYLNGTDYLSYTDKKQSGVKFGAITKAEIILHTTYISAFSISFSQASWRSLYGKANDPLEVWKSYKRYEKRLQFAANYYRKFKLGEFSALNAGLGFMVQGQQFNNNAYIYENDLISFPPDYNKLFWDPLLALNVQYLYRVNNNLSIGANLFTAYTFQIGIENAAMMGTIAIDMKNLFKHKNQQ